MNILKFFFYRRIEYDLRSPGNATQGPLVNNTRSPELHHKQIRKDSISSDLSSLTTDSDGMILNKIIFLLFFSMSNYIRS